MYNGKRDSKPKTACKPAPKDPVQWYDPVTGRLPQDIHNFVLQIDDFRALPRYERQRLLEGSVVRLTVENEFVAEVPLRLLLAASIEARNLYLTRLYPFVQMNISNTLYKEALKLIAAWMKDTCNTNKAYYLSPQDSFAKDVNIIAVATTLGMSMSVDHITRRHCAEIKRDPLTLPQLITIDRAAPSPDFSLLRCVVHRLANELIYGEDMHNGREFVVWMNQCPRISAILKKRYEKGLSEYRSKEEANKVKKQWAEQKAEFKATEKMAQDLLEEQNRVAKTNRDSERRRNQEMMHQVQERLNSGRVITITAEEARFIRRRGSGA
jgi:hypothetical protein